MSERIFEVSFIQSSEVCYSYETAMDSYEAGTFMSEEVSECHRCGDETTELEIVNGHPSCADCGANSKESTKRANEYQRGFYEEETK